jgi:hypothetical protein
MDNTGSNMTVLTKQKKNQIFLKQSAFQFWVKGILGNFIQQNSLPLMILLFHFFFEPGCTGNFYFICNYTLNLGNTFCAYVCTYRPAVLSCVLVLSGWSCFVLALSLLNEV